MSRRLALFLAIVLLCSPVLEARRRAVRVPGLRGGLVPRLEVQPRTTSTWDHLITTFGPVEAGTYVWSFRQSGAAALLIPLRGDVPSWLSTPSTYIYGGSEGSLNVRSLSMPETYDAIVYFARTKPVEELE